MLEPIEIEIVIVITAPGSQDFVPDAALPESAVAPVEEAQVDLSDEELTWLGRS